MHRFQPGYLSALRCRLTLRVAQPYSDVGHLCLALRSKRGEAALSALLGWVSGRVRVRVRVRVSVRVRVRVTVTVSVRLVLPREFRLLFHLLFQLGLG